MFEDRPYPTDFIKAVLEFPVASNPRCITDWDWQNDLLCSNRPSSEPQNADPRCIREELIEQVVCEGRAKGWLQR